MLSGGSRKFWWGGFEAQNLKNSDVFTKIESDFSAEVGNSTVFFAQIQVVSKKKKKKKKKVFTKIETDFSPDSLRLGRWGRMHPPHPPPKSATGYAPFKFLNFRMNFFFEESAI